MMDTQCANPSTPSGGEKDSIPPTLLHSRPENGAINFQEKSIVLEFDEYVQAPKLASTLLITPLGDLKYKSLVRNRSIVLKIPSGFLPNTTYNFNFLDAITDVTEKNPANFTLSFCTGPDIDSLQISGTVRDMLTSKVPKKTTKAFLYRVTDSLNVLLDKPQYLSVLGKDGGFTIRNIKEGTYRLISFDDVNGNLLLEVRDEAHGFVSEPIELNASVSSLELRQVVNDVTPLQLLSNRPYLGYYHIRFNKAIKWYEVRPVDSLMAKQVYSSLTDNDQNLRIYPQSFHLKEGDSTGVALSVKDGLEVMLHDTIQVKFNPSSKKLEKINSSLTLTKTLPDTVHGEITFSRPIRQMFPDSIRLRYKKEESLKAAEIWEYVWSQHRKKLNFNLPLSWPDSVFKATLVFPEGTFVSIDADTCTALSASPSRRELREYATLRINTKVPFPGYIIQMFRTGSKVPTLEYKNNPMFVSPYVGPGKYTVRLLVDEDANGVWDPGNLMKWIQPEPVINFDDTLVFRANWEQSIEITCKKVGINCSMQ